MAIAGAAAPFCSQYAPTAPGLHQVRDFGETSFQLSPLNTFYFLFFPTIAGGDQWHSFNGQRKKDFSFSYTAVFSSCVLRVVLEPHLALCDVTKGALFSSQWYHSFLILTSPVAGLFFCTQIFIFFFAGIHVFAFGNL